jgi:plasmid stability protein
VIAERTIDIIPSVKQMLLRVPEDVHRRLIARAARDGRSMNALATEILDAATDIDGGDRRARLAARAASLGVLRGTLAAPVSARERRRVLDSTRGIGPVLDELLAADRDRA